MKKEGGGGRIKNSYPKPFQTAILLFLFINIKYCSMACILFTHVNPLPRKGFPIDE